MLVYVTGVSTSGKSAVLVELRRRAFGAVGVDEDGYGTFVHRRTGRVVSPLPVGMDPHDWYPEHAWVFDAEKVARLARQAADDGTLMFLCGVAADEDRVWPAFDLVCALVVDTDTIRRRAAARALTVPHHFGSRQDELAQLLEWNAGYAETYRGFGAAIIDATRPLTAVVDDILDAGRRAGLLD